jgi:cytochrome bd-type quinol oxidase subunit 1
MEIIAAIVAALLGWKYATLGRTELAVLAIVVLGWTAVTAAATVPNVSVTDTALALVFRTFLIAVPYLAGTFAKRLRQRRL